MEKELGVEELTSALRTGCIAARSFVREKVLLRIGEHDYSADVVVGTRKNQKMRLYDVINLDPISITKKETSSVITGDPSREASRKALHLSNTSITENAEKSNSFDEKINAGRGGGVISKTRTVHAKSDLTREITDTSVLFLNENKKETNRWFQAQGQPVPMRGTQYGLIRTL